MTNFKTFQEKIDKFALEFNSKYTDMRKKCLYKALRHLDLNKIDRLIEFVVSNYPPHQLPIVNDVIKASYTLFGRPTLAQTLTEEEKAQIRALQAFKCQLCDQTGLVFATDNETKYDFVFRCQCPHGDKDSPLSPWKKPYERFYTAQYMEKVPAAQQIQAGGNVVPMGNFKTIGPSLKDFVEKIK